MAAPLPPKPLLVAVDTNVLLDLAEIQIAWELLRLADALYDTDYKSESGPGLTLLAMHGVPSNDRR